LQPAGLAALDVSARLGQLFDAYRRDDAPGCVVGVAHHGELVYRAAFGMANVEHRVANTPATPMPLASISKHFTCVAALRLAADGKLDLDQPIGRWIPELTEAQRRPTLRQLMSHTGGLRCYIEHAVFDGFSLLPAGHVLGSAMLYLQRRGQTFIYTGDFKLRPCATVPEARVKTADVLVMESTYGLPIFRFPPRDRVIDQLLQLVEQAFRNGRQPIVMGYGLGKAQEIVRILTDATYRPAVHGAIFHNNLTYESHGVNLGAYRRYAFEDFHGPAAMDLRERGVLVAPPQVARSAFVTRFDNPLRIMMTGWGMLKNAQYRYGVDHVLPLSDHADFDELLELVERVKPRKIFTHHGYREFARTLRDMGLDATCAKPDPQLTLFGE